MTPDDPLDPRISSWLTREAPSAVPQRVLSVTFERTSRARQLRALPRWRIFHMTPLPLPLPVRIAALALALLAGSLVVTRPQTSTNAPGALASPCPTDAPASTGSPPLGLALVCLDGSGSIDLGLPRDAWMADLSPDGSRVVFITIDKSISECGGCGFERRPALVAIEPSARRSSSWPESGGVGDYLYAGSETLDIDVASMAQPVWSPDGSRIAFQAETLGRPGQVDLFVKDLETDETWRLTDDPAIDEFPAWTPDGETILYANLGAEPPDDSGFSWTQEVWSVPVDEGTPRQLTFNASVDTMPDVATDGRVAFYREGDVWTMGIDGSDQARLDSVPAGTGFTPRWSPDASRLALLRYDPSERATPAPELGRDGSYPLLDVVVVDFATGSVTDMGTRVASDVNPVSWTPDGSALLVDRYDEER